jgi:hypothetical protein
LEKKKIKEFDLFYMGSQFLKVFWGLALDMFLVVGEVLVQVCSPEGGGMPKGVPEP